MARLLFFFEVQRKVAVGVIFGMGVLACLVSGTLYGVSLWLPTLKDALGMTQTQVNVIAGLGSLGQYLGFLSGLLNDTTSPRICMMAGCAVVSFGYVMTTLTAYRVFDPSWVLLGFFVFCIGMGSFATFTAGFSPSVHNISSDKRSLVMGCMVGGFAASSLWVSLVYRFFFTLNIPGYLLFLSLTCFFCTALAAVFVEKLPDDMSSTTTTITATVMPFSGVDNDLSMASMSMEEEVEVNNSKDDYDVPLTIPVTSTSSSSSSSMSSLSSDSSPKDLPPHRLLLDIDFLLLVGLLCFVNGPGLLWIMLQGSIAQSLENPQATQNLVALLAVCSILSRFATGYANDHYAKRFARSWFLVPFSALMSAAMFFFAFFQNTVTLYLCACLVGCAYGSVYVLTSTLSTTLFGTKWAGTNNGLMTIGTALSVLAFGLINGAIYAHYADPTNNHCTGTLCFRWTMVITAISAALGIPCAVWVSLRNPVEKLPQPIVQD